MHAILSRRLVARVVCTMLLLAGPAIVLIRDESAGATSKPKEIVVVGSKIKGSNASIRWNLTYQQNQNGVDHAAGHFWFSSPVHGEYGGPIVIGSLFNSEDPCGGLTFNGTLAIPRGQQEGFVMLQLVFALQPTDTSCSTQTRAGARLTSLNYAGNIDFRVEISLEDERTIQIASSGHGHLDFLKQVHDPA